MRARRRVAAALLAAAILAACSGGDDSGDGEPSPSSDSAGDVPVSGGTLELGLVAPSSYEPARANPGSHSEMLIADLLYDGLTRPGADGAAEPALAASWTSSPDLKVWTFVLAPERMFGSERVITSADVKWSIERMARQGDTSFAAARLEDIAGYGRFATGQAGELTGVRVVDAQTVEIALDNPLALLPQVLASPAFGIVAREAVEVPDVAAAPDPLPSSGLVVTDASDEHLRLERPDGLAGYVDAVDLIYFEDEAAAYDALVDGDVDWATVPPEEAGDAAGRFGEDGTTPFHAELFFGLNARHPKYADLRFRRAILKAIDREAIVTAVYAEVADPLASLVPAGVAGHVDDPCGDPCKHDLPAARALVSEVFGTAPVTEVFIDYDDNATQRSVAGIVEQQLEAAGIPATQRPRPFADYQTFAASGNQELFAFGWIGLYDSADAYLAPLFRTGARDNVSGFADPSIDALIAGARAQPDPALRIPAYLQAEAAVLGQAVTVPLAQFRTQIAYGERVRGLSVASDGTFDVSDVWLDG